jgi:hypothetical protein
MQTSSPTSKILQAADALSSEAIIGEEAWVEVIQQDGHDIC